MDGNTPHGEAKDKDKDKEIRTAPRSARQPAGPASVASRTNPKGQDKGEGEGRTSPPPPQRGGEGGGHRGGVVCSARRLVAPLMRDAPLPQWGDMVSMAGNAPFGMTSSSGTGCAPPTTTDPLPREAAADWNHAPYL